MDTLAALLEALHDSPGERLNWQVLADYLQEQGDSRGELLRLHLDLRAAAWGKGDPAKQARLVGLLDEGVRPCMPAVTNAAGMTFVLIPPGTFWMGSPDTEEGRYADESPLHEVAITRPFYLGVHPVTQDQYRRVGGDNPSTFRPGGQHHDRVEGLDTSLFPVENVCWREAVRFCRSLSALPAEQQAGRVYRLPTEAEWEYACRAGASALPFHFSSQLPPARAKYDDLEDRPAAVGSYPPNAWGLYDMHGNVWEWINDPMAADWYRRSPRHDPQGPGADDVRGFRGGGWCSSVGLCRAACRSADAEDFRSDYLGFRVVLEWRPPPRDVTP
jgi:uncharacterized protein (TIGR02996 family)